MRVAPGTPQTNGHIVSVPSRPDPNITVTIEPTAQPITLFLLAQLKTNFTMVLKPGANVAKIYMSTATAGVSGPSTVTGVSPSLVQTKAIDASGNATPHMLFLAPVRALLAGLEASFSPVPSLTSNVTVPPSDDVLTRGGYRMSDVCPNKCPASPSPVVFRAATGSWSSGEPQYKGPWELTTAADGTSATVGSAPSGWGGLATRTVGGASCGKHYFEVEYQGTKADEAHDLWFEGIGGTGPAETALVLNSSGALQGRRIGVAVDLDGGMVTYLGKDGPLEAASPLPTLYFEVMALRAAIATGGTLIYHKDNFAFPLPAGYSPGL